MVTSSTAGGEQLAESVEELRERLEAMKRMMARDRDEDFHLKESKNKVSCINASFLSFVFIVMLILIIGVSVHAFQNLYYAILKKFAHTREHTEL